MEEKKNYRIESIDLLRGLVMIIMALDHTRVFFNYGSFFSDPTNLETTTPFLFFTRWITHFCAPAFVFLAGTGAFLYGSRRETTKEVSIFLFTRGIWLVFVELTIVNFAWTFDISLSQPVFQVIWAIGFSMIVLSIIIFLPKKIILSIGILIVAAHNLLDPISFQGNSLKDIIWYLLHQEKFLPINDKFAVFFLYPVLPWIGVMILGYCFGELYQKDFPSEKRKKILLSFGVSAVILFLILRLTNIYGDMHPWQVQKNFIFTVMSILNTTKYPPSLLYILMTLGPLYVLSLLGRK